MSTFSKIKAVIKMPRDERNAAVKRIIHTKTQFFLDTAIFSTVGEWTNTGRSRFIIEHRPDFHTHSNGIRNYTELIKGWLAGNRHNNGGDIGRFYMIYLNVKQILEDRIPGAFVELGVYRGNSAKLLADLAKPEQREVFLFDTFEGFDRRDLKGLDGEKPVLFTNTSLADVKRLVGTDGVTYVPGFFPESAAHITMPQQIAVAHIDCDLYEPMKAGLEWFYPRLSVGGILILHDYASGDWPGAKRAIDEFFAARAEKPILAADKSGSALIRKAG